MHLHHLIPVHGARSSLGLLLLRLVAGLAFIFHGRTKMVDPTHWATHMLPGTPGWLQGLVAIAEFGGGFLLILGLLTPLVAFLLACDMSVAILGVNLANGGKFVGGPGAFELPLLYLSIMLLLLLAGPGAFSIDGSIARRTLAGEGRRYRPPSL